jgi:hypothetical protein
MECPAPIIFTYNEHGLYLRIKSTMADIPAQQWIDLMYAIQVHVEKKLNDGLLAELVNGLREHQAPVDPEAILALEPELRKCLPLIVPGLMVDFWVENGALNRSME